MEVLDDSLAYTWLGLSSAMPQWSWQDSIPVTAVRELIVVLRDMRLASWADPQATQELLNALDALSPGSQPRAAGLVRDQPEARWLTLRWRGEAVLATLWATRNANALAEYELRRSVAAAQQGPASQRASWADIANALGRTRQAAHDRFAHPSRIAPIVGLQGSTVAEVFTRLSHFVAAHEAENWLKLHITPFLPPRGAPLLSRRDELLARFSEVDVAQNIYWTGMPTGRRERLARIAAAQNIVRMVEREIDGLLWEAMVRNVGYADIARALAMSRQGARQRCRRLDITFLRVKLAGETDAARRVAYSIAGSADSPPADLKAAEDFLDLINEPVARDTKRRYR